MRVEPDLIASNLQAEYRLNLLTLSLDRSGGEANVLFNLQIPDRERSAALLTVPMSQVGVPRVESLPDQSDDAYALPEYLTHGIKSVLEGTSSPEAPLWIRFTAPSGVLPIVPWERLLQPALRLPILRLPYHAILSQPPQRSLDSVICFSAPRSAHSVDPESIADTFIRQIPSDLANYTTFHLFGDLEVQPVLHSIKSEFGRQFEINIYDPLQSARAARSRPRASPGSVQNPWLIWMRDSLAGRSADIVHFLCHCHLNQEDGALALSESPVSRGGEDCAGLVFAAEIADFLDSTGAWSVAFTSPPSNYSMAGMRMLQDQVARLRPGPCLLHNMMDPDAADGLAQAYRFLYVRGWQPPPNSSAVSLYCHPCREVQDVPSDPASNRLISEFTLAGRVPDVLASSSRPGWVATAQRILEQNISAFAVAPDSDERAAVVDGQKNAVRFVADLLAKHAHTPGEASPSPEADGGAEDPK